MCDSQRSGSRSRPPQYRNPSCKKRKKKNKTQKAFLLYRNSAQSDGSIPLQYYSTVCRSSTKSRLFISQTKKNIREIQKEKYDSHIERIHQPDESMVKKKRNLGLSIFLPSSAFIISQHISNIPPSLHTLLPPWRVFISRIFKPS